MQKKSQYARPLAIAAALLMAFTATTFAGLRAPEGVVVLVVSGEVGNANAGTEARFDRAMLEALPQHEIRTSTEWTDGVKVFRGPLVRDVLAAAGAGGSVATAGAVNDYKVEIPRQDFQDFPVILAMSMDGEALRLRDKGPLWIVYPRDEFPALQNPEMNSRWIWQLRSLEMR